MKKNLVPNRLLWHSCRRLLGDQRGMALALALLGVVSISLLAGSGAFSAKTDAQISRNDQLGKRALANANAGVNHVISLLKNDTSGAANGFNDELSSSGTGGVLASQGTAANLVSLSETTNQPTSQAYKFISFGGGASDGYYVRIFDDADETPNDTTKDVDNKVRIESVGMVGTSKRIVRAEITSTTSSTFAGALFGKQWVHFDSNINIDSYNSTSGSYGGSNVNYKGDVGTNGTTSAVLDANNSGTIKGSEWVGPGANIAGNTVITANASGRIASSATVTNSKKNLSATRTFTTPVAPVTSSYTLGTQSSIKVESGTTSYSWPPSGKTGVQISTELNIKAATVTITATSDLVIFVPKISMNDKGILNFANGSYNVTVVTDELDGCGGLSILKTGTGSVTFYAGKINLDSAFYINTTTMDPTKFTFNYTGTTSGTNRTRGEGTMYGLWNAPTSAVEFDSNLKLYGAVIGDTIKTNGAADVHYDEAFGTGGSTVSCCTITAWNELIAK